MGEEQAQDQDQQAPDEQAQAPGQEDAGTPDAAAAADEALDGVQSAVEELQDAGGVRALKLPDFERSMPEDAPDGLELLADVELDVKIELGRTHMLVEDVLRLADGSVVELDKLAGDPVDIYVNEQKVALGEVLVVNDTFCVRVSEIVAHDAPEHTAGAEAAPEVAGDAGDETGAEQEDAGAEEPPAGGDGEGAVEQAA